MAVQPTKAFREMISEERIKKVTFVCGSRGGQGVRNPLIVVFESSIPSSIKNPSKLDSWQNFLDPRMTFSFVLKCSFLSPVMGQYSVNSLFLVENVPVC